MSQWVSLSKSETIADFTAGRGALLSPYAKENCYGIELDVGNHATLIHQGYAKYSFALEIFLIKLTSLMTIQSMLLL